MDPAAKRGFAIGFVAVAVVAAIFAWREGWIPSPADRRAGAPAASVELVPKVPDRPDAKSETAPAEPRSSTAPPKADPPAPGVATSPPGASSGPTPGGGSAADAGRTTSGDVAALAPPGPAAPAPAPPAEKGAFDVVRVEPSGELVVAGRCAAGCTAELTANGKTQDKATADAAGNFAMVPPKLPPGDHQLGLKVTGPDGKSAVSEQSVTVSVPAPPSKEVVVVLNEPNAPSKILQQPGQAPAAAAPAQALAARKDGSAEERKTPAQTVASLSLGAVDAEKGRFFVQGTAPEGARLRVYLNNALIAEPVVGADERWSVRVERGLTPGAYVARVDHVDARSGKVVSRVEAKFAYEAEVAAAEPKPSAPTPRPAATPEEPARPQAPSGPASGPDAAPEPDRRAAAEPPAASAPTGGGVAGSSQPSNPSPAPPSAQAEREAAPAGAGDPGPVAAAPSGAGDGRTATPSEPNAPPPASATGAATSAAPRAAEAAPPQAAEASTPAPAPDAANPVVASIDTAQVKRGDSLWRISRTTYGLGRRYTVIFSANDEQIRNPNLIYPGQVLVLPADKTDAAEAAPR